MDISTIKEWANAITAPVLLVVAAIVLYRFAIYVGEKWVTPYSGPDGILAQFLAKLSGAVEQMPQAVDSQTAAYEKHSSRQEGLLERLVDGQTQLVDMHGAADEHGFGTKRTNQIAEQISLKLDDVLRVQKLLIQIHEKINDDSIKAQVDQAREILGRHVTK